MFGDSARKGLAAHLAVAQRLIELGFEVLEPVGNHLRYDLAYYVPANLDQRAQLVRIQCKSARLSKDGTCLFFNAYNLGGEGKRQRRGYHGDAEYFGVYSPDTRKVYMIHVDECVVNQIALHLENPWENGKNQFHKGVRWAKNYEI